MMKMTDEYVTLIEECGEPRKIKLDDAIDNLLFEFDWDDCIEVIEENMQLVDLQKAIRTNLTNEQKYGLLKKHEP